MTGAHLFPFQGWFTPIQVYLRWPHCFAQNTHVWFISITSHQAIASCEITSITPVKNFAENMFTFLQDRNLIPFLSLHKLLKPQVFSSNSGDWEGNSHAYFRNSPVIFWEIVLIKRLKQLWLVLRDGWSSYKSGGNSLQWLKNCLWLWEEPTPTICANSALSLFKVSTPGV